MHAYVDIQTINNRNTELREIIPHATGKIEMKIE